MSTISPRTKSPDHAGKDEARDARKAAKQKGWAMRAGAHRSQGSLQPPGAGVYKFHPNTDGCWGELNQPHASRPPMIRDA